MTDDDPDAVTGDITRRLAQANFESGDEQDARNLASAPADTIALPLLAPMAGFLWSFDLYTFGEMERDSIPADVRRLAADPGLTSGKSFGAVLRCGEFVLDHGPQVYGGVAEAWATPIESSRPPLDVLASTWWNAARPPLPLAALVASALADDVSVDSNTSLAETTDRPTRALAHALYQYACSLGVSTWNLAHREAAKYWANPANRESLLIAAWRVMADYDYAPKPVEREEQLAQQPADVAPAPDPEGTDPPVLTLLVGGVPGRRRRNRPSGPPDDPGPTPPA